MEGSLPVKHCVQLVEGSLPCGHSEVVSVEAPVVESGHQLRKGKKKKKIGTGRPNPGYLRTEEKSVALGLHLLYKAYQRITHLW